MARDRKIIEHYGVQEYETRADFPPASDPGPTTIYARDIKAHYKTNGTEWIGEGYSDSIADRPSAALFGKGTWQVGKTIYNSDGFSYKIADGSLEAIPTINLNSTIWRYPLSAAGKLDNSYWVYVAINADGDYAYFGIGTFATAVSSPNMGRFGIGRIGTELLHSAGTGVTKVGTWTESTPAGSYVSNIGSATAGEYVEFVTAGHTIAARYGTSTLGGLGVVSIDGDFTAANRLPTFTAADFTAGLCRETDVGKRYIDSYASGGYPDYHLMLADNLADTAHTVRFEATGTKQAAASAPGKLYVRAVIGCSNSDAGQAIDGTRVVAHIIPINDIQGTGTSTIVFTPEIEKTVATGTFEFLGHGHGGETGESLSIEVAGVDQTAMAAGEYISGSVINISTVATLASTDDAAVPICRKKIDMTFSSKVVLGQISIAVKATWLASKRVRTNYPMQLQMGHGNLGGSGWVNKWWDICNFGSFSSIPTDFSTNDGAAHGGELCLSAVIASTKHDYKADLSFTDGGEAINYFQRSASTGVFLSDRADFFDKVYFPRSTSVNIESFDTGDVLTANVAFKIFK